MYTGTIFNWYDNSAFEVPVNVPDSVNRPMFFVVNSFDKGPENIMEVDATTFNSLYGTMSYSRHGQAAIQAQNIINAGGRLLVKRVCANNADLANSVLVAKISETDNGVTELSWIIKSVKVIQATDGKPTYDKIKKAAKALYSEQNKEYPLFVITDNGRGLSNKAVRIIPDYDTARGLEKMIYRFYVYEGTSLIENANISLDPTYIFNNECYGLDKNRMTQVSGEVIPEIFDQFVEDVAKIVYKDVDTITDEMIANVSSYDLIYAYTYNGSDIYQLDADGNVVLDSDDKKVIALQAPVDAQGNPVEPEVDEDGFIKNADLNTPYGNTFNNVGDNGVYGVSPAKYGNENNVYAFIDVASGDKDFITKDFSDNPDALAYQTLTKDIARVFLGYDTDGKTHIDEVWDTDAHKIFAVADANYHKLVKDCIANFVEFRKDCIFFRDSNIGAYDVKSVKDVYEKYTLDYERYVKPSKFSDYATLLEVDPKIMSVTNLRSKFVADYGTTYEIIDPGSKKNIEVTMIYDLVTAVTTQYLESGPFAPLAGTYNGFELASAINGTVNFIPIITPSLNQKEAIDDLRLNYAIFEDEDLCVVQSNYTSQDKNTQLSFINNVLAIQEVARVVRTVCPSNRFSLITGNDMSEYATAVNRILEGYKSYFETLEFVYTTDPLRSIQKIFYASINFSFNNWAQTEIFDLYALANTTTTSVNS